MNTKSLTIFVIGMIFWLIFMTSVSQAQAPTRTLTEKEQLVLFTHNEAKKYNIDPIKLQKTIECESGYNKSAAGDGGKSRGVAQIHKRWHPNVSDKQAFDPYWSVTWAAKRFADGYAKEWTCYRELFM